MVLGIQIIGVLFGLMLVYVAFLNHKRKEFTLKEWGFWTAMAIAFSLISIFPYVLDPVVKKLSLSRTMDLLIIIGFMFVIAAVFYTYGVTRKNQKRLEDLVRKLALKNK